MTRFAGLGSNTASYLAKDSPFDDIGVAATIDSAKTEIARAINNARETGAESIFNAQKEAAEHYMDYGSQIGGIQRGAQLTGDLISAGTSLATAGIRKALDKPTVDSEGYQIGKHSDGSYGGLGGKYGLFEDPTEDINRAGISEFGMW